MVKGVTRRVVVVRPPSDRAAFEQAIFFLRDDGREHKDALRDACAVAEGYLRTAPRRTRSHWFSRRQLYLSFCAGVVCTGLVWLVAAIFL